MLDFSGLPGKHRGLAATATPTGIFTILALDHRQSFFKMLNPDDPGSVPFSDAVSAKAQVVSMLAPHASGVLLDPLFGAAQAIVSGALPGQTGLLVAVEKTGYSGETTARRSRILPDWSVAKIKRLGANAVKLLIYFHPHSGTLAQRQEQLVQEVVDQCREYDIPLFLESVSYSIDPLHDKRSRRFATLRPQIIAESAHRLSRLRPDVLKLEFPVDASMDQDQDHWLAACEAVSEASDLPWTVLSAGVDLPTFARQVEIACRAGASGYIAGRSVWKEAITMPENQQEAWLRDVGASRLEALSAIAEEYARPWTSFLDPAAPLPGKGWHARYGVPASR
ncbi:MAG: tagatose 1,6-diphosphate aldolase [Chloroflexota bacterium]|nr:tagatose 1,6-diphosphate aldolase [Chloroflexota bacterium]